MAADLSIHIYEGITQDDMKRFFSSTLGSKYFNMSTPSNYDDGMYEKFGNTPSVWIGEVSWLKAVITDDAETFVPHPCQAICDIIKEDLPVIDDALISKIVNACSVENSTDYDTANPDKVKLFLEEHKGKKVFTVSW